MTEWNTKLKNYRLKLNCSLKEEMVGCKGMKGGMEPVETKAESKTLHTTFLFDAKRIANEIMNDQTKTSEYKQNEIGKIRRSVELQIIQKIMREKGEIGLKKQHKK